VLHKNEHCVVISYKKNQTKTLHQQHTTLALSGVPIPIRQNTSMVSKCQL
jgi:hypothetical protein